MSASKKKILLVDDEPTLLGLMRKILKEEGFTVDIAENGETALKKVGTFKPDLVLLDIMMPGMSGVEVCQKMRDDPKTKDIKVVFLTVVPFTSAGVNVLHEFGALDYITKPTETKELLKRIGKALKA